MPCGPRAACNTRHRSADRNVIRKADCLPSGFSFQGMVPMASQEVLREEPSRGSFINDPKVRGVFFQAVVVILLVAGVWWIVHNVIENLQRLHIASGFGFLKSR